MKKILLSILLLSLISVNFYSQDKKSLPRSTPQAQKVDEQGITDFIKALKDKDMDIHSLMILRHGKVVSEQWFGDNSATTSHILYSVTKTYTCMAVGFAVAEKKIKVTDKVISFFPDKLPAEVSPYLAEMEIQHLLTMSVGNDPNAMNKDEKDWVKEFLSLPVNIKPGTQFSYSSMATYMLAAIIQKVSGKTLSEYLAVRLFIPMGIREIQWQVCPMGINTGGYGLYLCTEDMAKLGQFILQKGKWNGKQLLPKSWIKSATSFQVASLPSWVKWEDRDTVAADSDWKQGYGYQMWMCTHNAFRADGANGQFIIILPEKDAVIAITADISDMSAELNLVWEKLLPALK